MSTRKLAPLIFVLLAAAPLAAQDGGVDAGPTDAGPVDGGVDAGADAGPQDAGVLDAGEQDAGPCTPRCAGNTLLFCDGETPSSIDCGDLGASCALLSPEWGFDCLLPEGADCEPGYGDGLSACAGAAAGTRCCVDDTCQPPASVPSDCQTFAPQAPEVPTEGPLDAPVAPPQDPLGGCVNCNSAGALFFPGLILLQLARARRRD